MDDTQSRLITRLIAKAGQMLLSHGAESRLVGDIMVRIGVACGADKVEVSLSASSLTVTTIMNERCMTTVRRCPDSGINMRVVTEIQRICIMLERKIIDFDLARHRLDKVKVKKYPRAVVMVMVALSCAAFASLAGGDLKVCFVTLIASGAGMFVRQEIAEHHFNPLVNFFCTALVTTIISSQAFKYDIGNDPFIAMSSSVLMLVPGFPLINSVADMIRGYINMGIARFAMASLLTFATCLGIVAAMTITNTWEWL